MCGILGQVSNNFVVENEFESILSLLDHRGPDDKGTYFHGNVALGQTRLSIMDLSKDGHQPMVDETKNYIITYNGEVYNYEEIKQELLQKGYNFFSNTDTEVILKGFIEFNEQIVEKLNGMFAFAIYEKSSGKIFLARDRSGIKPLYYYAEKDNFLFSSEIKALKHLSKGYDLKAKILFLLLGSVPEPFTICKGISMFPAGCYAYYQNGKLIIEKFNDYSYEPKILKPYSEILEDVNGLLFKSVERHLISDAPIGTFLSGGLDSSVLTAIAAKYKPKLRTISLIFDEKQYSEKVYQDLIVNKYKTEHTNYLITEKIFLDTIEEFVNSFDQPTIDGFNTFLVSKAANESGLRTVLSGVGGDEIFYGYPSFKNAKKFNLLKKVPWFIISILKNAKKYKKLELLRIENELALYLPTRALFTPTEISKILNIEVNLIYEAIADLWEMNHNVKNNFIDDKISFMELSMYMKNQLLRDTDVFGMANSLEIRVPFLDKDLVDYVLKISPENKYNKNINKIVLADAVKDLIPSEILNRPKMGFTLPFENWFRKYLAESTIDESYKSEFFNKNLHWSRIWALIILQKFD